MSRNRIAKRALAGILSAAFVLAALPAYAEEDTGSSTTGETGSGETTASENTEKGSTAVTFSQDNEWIVTIPELVTLSTTEIVSSKITAKKINIAPGKKLQVSVNTGVSNGKVTLTRANDNDSAKKTITSTVSLSKDDESIGDGISNNAVVAVFTGTKTGSEENPISGDNNSGILYFSKIIETDIPAGSYEGTITFTMGLANSTSSSEGTDQTDTEATDGAQTP